MSQTRSLLFIAWLFVAGWLWLQWSEGSTNPAADTPATAATSATPFAATPTTAAALPSAPMSAAVPGAPASAASSVPGTPVVRVRNDVLELAIDARGTVVGSRLLAYRKEKTADSPNVELLAVDPASRFAANDGLMVLEGDTPRELQARFSPADGRAEASLPDGAEELRVPLVWTDESRGLTVTRTLVLHRGSYLLSVEDAIANTGAAAQRVYPFVELERTAPPPPPKIHGLTNPESLSFVGAVWYGKGGEYHRSALKDVADDAPLNEQVTGGWIGMLQHHFLTAWVPPAGENQVVSLAQAAGPGGAPLYRIRSVASPLDVAPGATGEHASRLWVGPKLQRQLGALAPGLDRAVDYSRFTILAVLADLLFKLLSLLHGVLGNWGWSIIAIVVLVKAALYWVSAKQYKSMARMRALQPRIEALKERHGEDRQAFQMAMMDLYKKEKVNPVTGCLPILVTMPIFIALYDLLLESVELRHAPWVGWIQNLTAPDPYFVLPAINLVVMFVTQRMTPTPGMDPMQKKMMTVMPLVFGVTMAFFPAGLVLYWVTNGLLGLLQQWWMARQYGGPAAPSKPARPATVAR